MKQEVITDLDIQALVDNADALTNSGRAGLLAKEMRCCDVATD